MLLCKLCGRCHQQGEDTWKCLIGRGYFIAFPYTGIAEPAHQAVDRRKEVSGLVNAVQKCQQPVTEAVNSKGRPDICSGKSNIKCSAHQTGHHVRHDKAVKILPVVTVDSCYQYIVYDPKQITAKVNIHPLRNQRNLLIQPGCQIVVVPVSAKGHGTAVNQHIQCKAGEQWHDGK